MQVTVVGTGNVGAALLFPLAPNDAIDRISVMSRQECTATAAIMDVASAFPEQAMRFQFDSGDGISESDVIVITAGENQKGKTADQTHASNLDIARTVLSGKKLKQSAIVICIATPVDYITPQVQSECGLPARQVIGFGGDLDSNRLRYILQNHAIPHLDAYAVGEHGPNAVPLYPGEQDYTGIVKELRGFWGKLAGNVDVVRNIATAHLLGDLVNAVVGDSMTMHNICALHPDYGIYMTWPFKIGRYGVEQPMDLYVPPLAAKELDALVTRRRDTIGVLAL